jgi:hypothetical protein
VRSRSQWIKNLAVTPQTKVWLRGESVPVTAYVIGPELSDSEEIPAPTPLVQFLIKRLRRLSQLTGANYAILDRHVAQVPAG